MQTKENNAFALKTIDNILNFFKNHWYYILLCSVLVLAVSYRIETYAINRQFWYDEAQLALNYITNSGVLWVFKPLDNLQVAPPLFLTVVKLFTIMFGTSEYVFRLFPFLVSLASVFVFCKLTKRFLKTKHSIIIANVLFAISFQMTRFSSEFKQYGCDSLIFMLALMWLGEINTNKLTLRQVLQYSIVFAILFFLSQPVIFALFGFTLYNVLKNYKNYKIYLIPIIPVFCAFIYKFSMPKFLRDFMDSFWGNEAGFISFNNLPDFLEGNYEFFLQGSSYMAPMLPLLIIGLYLIFIQNSSINRIFLYAFIGALLASALHFYPFTSKMILFLFPVYFIAIAKCFDFDFQNKLLNKIFKIFLILSAFIVLFLFQGKIICKNRINILQNMCQAREIMTILIEKINPQNDIIFLPSLSENLFKYYSYEQGFNVDDFKIFKINTLDADKFRQDISLITNNQALDGKFIWVVGCFLDETIISSDIKEWINENAKFYYKISLSTRTHLYYIKLK